MHTYKNAPNNQITLCPHHIILQGIKQSWSKSHILIYLKIMLCSDYLYSNLFLASLAGKIQVSNATNMMLECVGGYVTQERGTVEIKVRWRMGFEARDKTKCFH